MMGSFIRWSRVRGLVEGLLQRGRVEGHENEAIDAAPRPQDYGFAGNPGAGEALYLEIDGQPVILRIDRVSTRPRLASLEVAIWHDEGHMVRLKAGRIVEVDCARLVVNASDGVDLNTPTVAMSGGATVGQSLQAAVDVSAGGKSLITHVHGQVVRGNENSGPPT